MGVQISLNIREGTFSIESPGATLDEVTQASVALAKLDLPISRGVLFDTYMIVVDGSSVVLSHGGTLEDARLEGYRRAARHVREAVSVEMAKIVAEAGLGS